jgi:hypothetical protein
MEIRKSARTDLRRSETVGDRSTLALDEIGRLGKGNEWQDKLAQRIVDYSFGLGA